MLKQILLLSSLAFSISLSTLSASPLPDGDGQWERQPLYSILGSDTTCNIFLYSPGAKAGLHVAYLNDKEQWQDMGSLCGSSYASGNGQSGAMLTPYVYHAADGSWRLLFGVNGTASCFAAAYSEDLVTWRPQDFPKLREKGITEPVMFQMDDGTFDIYVKAADGTHRYVKADKDFRHFNEDSVASSISNDAWIMDTATVAGRCYDGNQYEVPKVHLDYIMHYFAALANDNRLSAESMKDDASRFAPLGNNLEATLTVDASKVKAISGKVNGMDIADINRMADGGLYAELLNDNGYSGSKAFVTKHDTLFNSGWGGIVALPQQQFDFSVNMRVRSGKKSQAVVAIVDDNGEEFAKEKIKLDGTGWQHCALPLTIEDNRKEKASAKDSTFSLRLMLTGLKDDSIDVDRVSLFPHETFKGHKMKKTLGEAVAAMRPGFIRLDANVVNKKQGASLYDYMQFCKDIDAEPVLEFAADANSNDILDVLAAADNDTMLVKPKIILIGNGSSVNTPYEEHFTAIANTIKNKYPAMNIVCSTGFEHNPSHDYAEGLKFANANKRLVGMVSENYVATPGWFMHHQDYYDGYDRNDAKVILCDWGSKGNTVEDALAEALYLCSLERNGDVVAMSMYSHDAVSAVSPSHDIQKLLGSHSGNNYIFSSIAPTSGQGATIGYRIGASVVKDASGRTCVKFVNALPLSLTVSVAGLQIPDGTIAEGFAGKPADTKVQAIKAAVNGQKLTLPPYSVVVVE